jgi:hypothetical protein
MNQQERAGRAAAEIASAMYFMNNKREGDYVLVLKSTVSGDSQTFTWDWWWRPPGLIGVEGAGAT